MLAYNAQLTKLLTYHVLPGKVVAADVQSLTSAPTVEGSALTIDTSSGAVKVDQALVTQADIEADKGVMHVVDTIIISS